MSKEAVTNLLKDRHVPRIYLNSIPLFAKIPCLICSTGSAEYLLIHDCLCNVLCEECKEELYASIIEYEEAYEEEDRHHVGIFKITGIKAEVER